MYPYFSFFDKGFSSYPFSHGRLTIERITVQHLIATDFDNGMMQRVAIVEDDFMKSQSAHVMVWHGYLVLGWRSGIMASVGGGGACPWRLESRARLSVFIFSVGFSLLVCMRKSLTALIIISLSVVVFSPGL